MKKILVVFFGLFCLLSAGFSGAEAGNGSLAGFYEIEPISYYFQDRFHGVLNLTTSKSNIFYSYHPADERLGGELPLFVMLNGGPGAATATNLFSMNTAPYTLDRERQKQGGRGYSPNDHSWTKLGNLLYIDAPGTGFSYLEAPGVSNIISGLAIRTYQFLGKGNFNTYIDAAQIVRVILRFLTDHPEIRANEVILVGESYGGSRVSTMLSLLLFHPHYGQGGEKIFIDPALAQEIERHFKEIFGQDTKVTPQVVARQFARQILIQPELAGGLQDEISGKMFYGEAPYYDTVIKDLARETGNSFPGPVIPPKYWICDKATRVLMYYVPQRFGRDRYNYSKGKTWSDDLEAYAAMTLRDYNALSAVLRYDPAKIEKMLPKNREDAFKLLVGIKTGSGWTMGEEVLTDSEWLDDPANAQYLPKDPNAAARLEAQAESMTYMDDLQFSSLDEGVVYLWDKLGRLNRWDGYMVEMNLPVYLSFTQGATLESKYNINPDSSSEYGRMFLENIALVKTFLTDAYYDLVIYSPAIPEALKQYSYMVKDVTCLRGSEFSDKTRGAFRIDYHPGSLEHTSTPEYVYLYYPYYATSGHSVSSSQPDKLLRDVENWLNTDEADYYPQSARQEK